MRGKERTIVVTRQQKSVNSNIMITHFSDRETWREAQRIALAGAVRRLPQAPHQALRTSWFESIVPLSARKDEQGRKETQCGWFATARPGRHRLSTGGAPPVHWCASPHAQPHVSHTPPRMRIALLFSLAAVIAVGVCLHFMLSLVFPLCIIWFRHCFLGVSRPSLLFAPLRLPNCSDCGLVCGAHHRSRALAIRRVLRSSFLLPA